METPPRCEYCGKFIATDKNELGKTWDVKLIWCGSPIPEPSHDVFWHVNCANKKDADDEQ